MTEILPLKGIDAPNNGARGCGLLVAFCGIDGSGKTELSRRVVLKMEDVGICSTRFVSFSGNESKYWQTVMDSKRMMSASDDPIPPEIDQSLHLFEFLTYAQNTLPKLLTEVPIVIAERYALGRAALIRWDTGIKGSWPEKTLLKAVESGRIIRPDLTILLDVTVEEATRRLIKRGPPFEEKEKPEHLKTVKENLLDLANCTEYGQKGVEIVDTTNHPAEELATMITQRIINFRQK